jgi:hypothetical protein
MSEKNASTKPHDKARDTTTGSAMTQDAIPPRHPALDEFMSELRALRQSAGQPSFRKMAQKSGAVSHATLHLSVTGYRLQPWETVREFVRACNGDESEWHAKWQRVARQLTADNDPGAGAATEAESEATAGERSAEHTADRERSGERKPKWWFIPAAAALVVAGVVGVVALLGGEDNPPEVPTKNAASDTGGEDPMAGPAYPGDKSRFIADVSVPDGTEVKPGSTFDKIWEIQNAGSVEWTHRFLQRDDSIAGKQPCQTPKRIPVENTRPGENVKIKVRVRAPKVAPSGCKVYWKMVDSTGKLMFPSARPIYFEVVVRK